MMITILRCADILFQLWFYSTVIIFFLTLVYIVIDASQIFWV